MHRSLHPQVSCYHSMLQGVRSAVVGPPHEHTKSNLDNIVGSLWQARQESSGSSRGDQVRPGIMVIMVTVESSSCFCEL